MGPQFLQVFSPQEERLWYGSIAAPANRGVHAGAEVQVCKPQVLSKGESIRSYVPRSQRSIHWHGEVIHIGRHRSAATLHHGFFAGPYPQEEIVSHIGVSLAQTVTFARGECEIRGRERILDSAAAFYIDAYSCASAVRFGDNGKTAEGARMRDAEEEGRSVIKGNWKWPTRAAICEQGGGAGAMGKGRKKKSEDRPAHSIAFAHADVVDVPEACHFVRVKEVASDFGKLVHVSAAAIEKVDKGGPFGIWRLSLVS
jgi:hypothetical protein